MVRLHSFSSPTDQDQTLGRLADLTARCHLPLHYLSRLNARGARVVGTKCGSSGVKPDKAWTGDEARRFLEFTADDGRLHPIWQLALVGGLRRGELCGLKWEDVDFDKGTVRIVRTRVTVNGQPEDCEPKTRGSRRTLNLSPITRYLKALQKIQKEDRLLAGGAYVDHGYLVADALGSPCHPETISGWFEAAVAGCGGLRGISLHGCRHTCATNMLKAGEPVHVVSRFLGHSNVQITLDVYGHVLPGQEEQAVTALVADIPETSVL